MEKIPKNWSFKRKDVAEAFDEHVREQLPWYELATKAVSHFARHYVPTNNGIVYDIGASTGNIGLALKNIIDERNPEFIEIDNSEEMKVVYKGIGKLEISNAENYNYKKFDLAICFLVLMFITPEDRIKLINNLKSKMKKGGAIIVFDKCEMFSGYAGTIISRMSLSAKLEQGVSPKEIIEKELSLSGIQRPINPKILGEDVVEWMRFGDFAGFIIENKG